MTDREKVIRLIEEEINVCESVNQCYRTIDLPVLRDILALLIEQDAVGPEFLRNEWRCGACGHVVLTYCFDINEGEMGKVMANYCPSCGRKVKWE